jgi:hypothetical protein
VLGSFFVFNKASSSSLLKRKPQLVPGSFCMKLGRFFYLKKIKIKILNKADNKSLVLTTEGKSGKIGEGSS